MSLRKAVDRGYYRTTTGVTKHEQKLGRQNAGAEKEGVDQSAAGGIACHPRHEYIAQTLVKDQLGRNSRVRAGKDRCERRLWVGRNTGAAAGVFVRMLLGSGSPSGVTRQQRCQRIGRSRGRIGVADYGLRQRVITPDDRRNSARQNG